MPNDYIDQVTLNGTVYDIRDSSAIHESASVYNGQLILAQGDKGGDTLFTANQSGNSTLRVYSSTLSSAITFNAGSIPTLGTAIAADDITSWAANTPTSIDTTKFSGGSFTRGAFNGGSFTQGNDSFTENTPTDISFVFPSNTTAESPGTVTMFYSKGTSASFTQGTDSFTAATHSNDSFTAAALNTGFYSAGTAASLSYTSRSIPNVTSAGVAPSLTITSTSIVTSIAANPL